MNEREFDAKLFDLYDEYCHGSMKRREFLASAAALAAIAGLPGCGEKAKELLPDYAKTVTVSFTDPRIKAKFVEYESPGGNGKMRGYLVTPVEPGACGAVLVVHENRGLNPYVQDVARRVAVDGFIAFAPDALAPLGGYPGNDDDGKAMQRQLDRAKIHADMLNGAKLVKSHERCNGKLGVTGFCFGGGVSNYLAVEMGDELQAAAPFYGAPADLKRVGEIRAKMAIHYAENDPRVNEHKDAYEAALKAAGVDHTMYVYPGTQHGFHNNSTPRYDHAAATLAWQRTIDLFKATLA
ncbi:MAG: dienelactone hydrolase family protein [Planctomycetes bacterium]|nr:dienelactone hydrolase family protein [Planctomycetota bacterium]MCB9901790.1 dienelactone hydrolase family protein [Planctomycetota bacterium]